MSRLPRRGSQRVQRRLQFRCAPSQARPLTFRAVERLGGAPALIVHQQPLRLIVCAHGPYAGMMSTRLEHATRMSTPVINVNGRIAQGTDATIPVLDHGFLYGEGVYEVCRTYHGQPLLFDRHMRRMRSSAGMIAMPVPFTDDEALALVYETLAAASLATPGAPGPEAYVRLLLTRGVGELSYDPAACVRPSVVVIVKAHVEPPADIYSVGVRVSLVPIVRNHPRSLNPLIKSNNLLNNALAMQHALRDGAFEAVMRNHRGEIAECSQSNLFVVKSGSVITPPIDAGLLAGITRELLFEVAREMGVPMAESLINDEDLLGADEAFLSSTTREVVPIVQVDEHLIGTGRPGPVTRALLEGFRRRADLLTGGGSVSQG